jgi:hypothetical protein
VGNSITGRPTTARKAQLAVGGADGVGEEVVLVGAGGAAAQHLGHRQLHAVAHELGTDHLGLGRPDVLLQPHHQRQVVGQPAQQGHGVVRVGVDQARDQRVLGQAHGFAGGVSGARLRDGQHGDNAVAAHRHRVVFQHHGVRFDRDDPAGFDQQVDRLGRVMIHGRHFAELHQKYGMSAYDLPS